MIEIGKHYRFAPGGYVAFRQWYAAFTHSHYTFGIQELDVLQAERLSNRGETNWLGEESLLFINLHSTFYVWMPVSRAGEWLVEVERGGAA